MTSLRQRQSRALVASMLAAALAACGAPRTTTSLVSQGLKAQLAGDDSTAESQYLQALNVDPNNAVAHYDLGTVYDSQGNKSKAVEEYLAAAVINPSFADALFNLAVDTARSDPSSAAELYLKVLTLRPSFAAAWLNMGFILEGEGNAAAAKTDWAKAVLLDPSLASRIPSAQPTPASKP